MSEESLKRVQRLKEHLLNTRPEMDLENARLLTEGFREAEGLPLILRKAVAIRKQCVEKTIFIGEDELIVGNSGSKLRGGILCADSCWSVLDAELETIGNRPYDPFYLLPEDKELFKREIKPYWQGRSNYEQWLRRIPPATRLLRDNGAIYIDRKAVRGFGETTAGYAWLLTAGLQGITAVIEERRSRLDLTRPGDLERDNFLTALLTVGVMRGNEGYFLVTLLMSIGLGAAAGLLNGAGVALIGLPPMIVTMCVANVFNRLQYVLTEGKPSGTASRWFVRSMTYRFGSVFPSSAFYGIAIFALVFF
ncbi:MAG: hypothetical protein FWG06_03515, partial [Clostridiales bacterium]|nr:hypothetical protein [Clostridiales bacterium]